jgi:hypothetical protein
MARQFLVSLAIIGRLLLWLVASTTGSALFFVEDLGKRPDLPVSVDLIWRKISHQGAGGVSTQVSLFGFFRLGGWTLDEKVGREIGHISDYSLRPKPVEFEVSFGPALYRYAPPSANLEYTASM